MSNFTRIESIIIQKLSGLVQVYRPEDWVLFEHSLPNLMAEAQLRTQLAKAQTPVLPNDWAEMEQLLNETTLDRLVNQQLENHPFTADSPDFDAFWERKSTLAFDREIEAKLTTLQSARSDWGDFENLLVEKELSEKINAHTFAETPNWTEFEQTLVEKQFKQRLETHEAEETPDWIAFEQLMTEGEFEQKLANYEVQETPNWADFEQILTENAFRTKLENHEVPALATDWADFAHKFFPENTELLLKDKIAGVRFVPLAGDWAEMERLLDKNKRRGAAFWWKKSSWVMLGLLLMLLLGGAWWWNHANPAAEKPLRDSVKHSSQPIPPTNATPKTSAEHTETSESQSQEQPKIVIAPTKVQADAVWKGDSKNVDNQQVLQKNDNPIFNSALPKAKTYPLAATQTTQVATQLTPPVVKVSTKNQATLTPVISQQAENQSEANKIANPSSPTLQTIPTIAATETTAQIVKQADNQADISKETPKILSSVAQMKGKSQPLLTANVRFDANGLLQQKQNKGLQVQAAHIGLYGAAFGSVAELKDLSSSLRGGAVGIRSEVEMGRWSLVNGLVWGQKNIETYYYKYSPRLQDFYLHKLVGATRELGFVVNAKYRQPLYKKWSLYGQAGIMPFISLREDYKHYDPTTIENYAYASRQDFASMTPDIQSHQFRTYWGYAQGMVGVQFDYQRFHFYLEPFAQWSLAKLSTEQKRIHSFGVGGGVSYRLYQR